ncbi:MAG: hypothetical protein R3F45_11990 [Gammaproteobacteria bacterium]
MILSSVELARIREVVNDMLERLGLQTYLFEVEPRDGPWEVRVECATPEGAWQTVTIALDAAQLRASLHDEATREQVLARLASRLGGCGRGGAGQAKGPGSA